MRSERRACVFLVGAQASGQGKTWLTAALARHHRAEGRRVRVLKLGPDFLDPFVLARASGSPVYSLDVFMAGLEACRRLVWEAADSADVVLIESVMGLFDGSPSSADLAHALGIPVLLVIDASAMAQTFGAIAHGLARYDPRLRVDGVVANRVAGAGHRAMLRESLREVPFLGAFEHLPESALPERHLGLVAPAEIPDIEARLELAAAKVAVEPVGGYLPEVALREAEAPHRRALLRGVRVGVAADRAFCFVYPENLDVLRALGACYRPSSLMALRAT